MNEVVSACVHFIESDWGQNLHAVPSTVSGGAQSLLDNAVVWHDSWRPQQDCHGRAEVSQLRAALHDTFPDLSYHVADAHGADSGHVLLYWTATGTQLGAWSDGSISLQPTGMVVSFTGSCVFLVAEAIAAAIAEDDSAATALLPQAVEVWCSWDPLLVTQQLQAAKGTASLAAVPLTRDSSAGPTTSTASVESAAGTPIACSVSQKWSNLEVVELYFKAYNTGDYSILHDIVHPTYSYAGLLDLGSLRGETAMAAMMDGWRKALLDLTISHEFCVAVDGNRVMFRWVIQGTHTGCELRGIPPSGSRVLVKGVTTLTLTDGHISQKVSHANGADLLMQLRAGAAADAVDDCARSEVC